MISWLVCGLQELTPPLNPALWRPTWPKDGSKYGQDGKHLEAKKWQNYVGIRIFRLAGEKLTLYNDILADLWALGANPQLNPALWRPEWPKDWSKYG